jgi:hypothetical protein
MIAWIGDSCESLSQNGNYHFNDDELAITSGVHCPTGYYAVISGIDWSCDNGLLAVSTSPYDFKKGVYNGCTTGDMAISSINTNSVVTHFMSL